MNLKRCARQGRAVLLACAAAAVLSACGGGGGGDDAGADVSITLVSPATVAQTVGRDYPTQDIPIQVKVLGDLASLDGKTLYVQLHDSNDMFEPVPVVDLGSSSGDVTGSILGKVAATEGRTTGTLSIDVCYDAACTHAMRGSPLRISYVVDVLPGLDVAVTEPVYSTLFGTALPPQDIVVRLPGNVNNWFVTTLPEDGGFPSETAIATKVEGADAESGIVRLTMTPREPGHYTTTYRVVARAPNPFGAEYEYVQDIHIDYTVQDNPGVDYWISPGRIDIVRQQGDEQAGQAHGYSLLGNTGIALVYDRIEYLSSPPESAGHLLHEDWWSVSTQNEAVCRFEGANTVPDCLPAGDYTARLRFRYDKAGQTLYADLPIHLTIEPAP